MLLKRDPSLTEKVIPKMLESKSVKSLLDATFDLAKDRAGSARPSAGGAKGRKAPTGKAASKKTTNEATSPKWDRPVGDEAVEAKTGRNWDQWIAALDAEGCAGMTHREIVAIVNGTFGVGPWWGQMVTVGYERARGLRATNETTSGYQVGVSKTIDAPVETTWRAWNDVRSRKRWLAEGFTVRKATEPKSMRITWHDGTDLQVLFYAKGSAKSQVTIDHRKLPQDRVGEMKAFWKERLAALEEQLER